MIYVMSDIHGNMRRFDSVMNQIQLQPGDTLYVLGDVIDRYPDGIRILRQIMSMPNVKMLLGNHEYMMLNALEYVPQKDAAAANRAMNLWYRNGGEVTHNYWKRIRKSVREEIAKYLMSLPLNIDVTVDETEYKLVHGAPVEEYEVCGARYANVEEFAVWKRWKGHELLIMDQVMIFGHTPTMQYQSNIPMEVLFDLDGLGIGIDCGSGFSDHPLYPYAPYGRLACLRLDDMKVFYSEEKLEERCEQ